MRTLKTETKRCEECTKNCSDRITGNKNPAYDHGGRLSPFSDKFVGYE